MHAEDGESVPGKLLITQTSTLPILSAQRLQLKDIDFCFSFVLPICTTDHTTSLHHKGVCSVLQFCSQEGCLSSFKQLPLY